jgi:hypothetical protein
MQSCDEIQPGEYATDPQRSSRIQRRERRNSKVGKGTVLDTMSHLPPGLITAAVPMPGM